MTFLSQPQPPTPDAFHGESGRVMADADIHPTDIVSDVIDPVRRRLAELLVGKVRTLSTSGRPFGRHSRPPFLKSPHQFLLLGIH